MTMWNPTLDGRKGPRYRAIVDALAEDFAAGELRQGTRLPTHRDLADTLGVTVGTVSRAYAEAARRGLVSGEVGRGHVRARAARRERRGGRRGLRPEPEPSARAGRRGCSARRSSTRSRASPRAATSAGCSTIRRRAAARPTARRGRPGSRAPASRVSPDEVLVCTGSQHGLTVVLATLLEPGDVLLTESLTYAGLQPVAGLLRLRLRGLPIDGQGLLPDALDAACRETRREGALPDPHAPQPDDRGDAGGAAARDRRRSRERTACASSRTTCTACCRLERPAPIATLAPERSYYLTSTSKTLAPGLRIAYVAAPPADVPRLAASLRATTWAVAPLTAAIASHWIRDGTADRILEARRLEARERQALARERLAGFDVDTQPEAYYLWLRLPEPWRSESFAAEARARRRARDAGRRLRAWTASSRRTRCACASAPRARARRWRAGSTRWRRSRGAAGASRAARWSEGSGLES